jgi:hypothetical protein
MERALNELGSIHPPYYSTTFEKGNKACTVWKTEIEFNYNNAIHVSLKSNSHAT